jgi:hypothetical protein
MSKKWDIGKILWVTTAVTLGAVGITMVLKPPPSMAKLQKKK